MRKQLTRACVAPLLRAALPLISGGTRAFADVAAEAVRMGDVIGLCLLACHAAPAFTVGTIHTVIGSQAPQLAALMDDEARCLRCCTGPKPRACESAPHEAHSKRRPSQREGDTIMCPHLLPTAPHMPSLTPCSRGRHCRPSPWRQLCRRCRWQRMRGTPATLRRWPLPTRQTQSEEAEGVDYLRIVGAWGA